MLTAGPGGQLRIELACAECGNNRFSLDDAEHDSSLIYCKDCGHRIGTLAELKDRIASEVLRRADAPPRAP